MVDSFLFINKPTKLLNEDVSELIYSDSTARIIICMDESHHPLTIETDSGGSRSVSYGLIMTIDEVDVVQEVVVIFQECIYLMHLMKFCLRFLYLIVLLNMI